MALFTAKDFTLTGVGLNPRTVGVYLETSRELVEDVMSTGCAGGRDSNPGVGLMMHSPASL